MSLIADRKSKSEVDWEVAEKLTIGIVIKKQKYSSYEIKNARNPHWLALFNAVNYFPILMRFQKQE
jgi:hypothetical protein